MADPVIEHLAGTIIFRGCSDMKPSSARIAATRLKEDINSAPCFRMRKRIGSSDPANISSYLAGLVWIARYFPALSNDKTHHRY